MFTLINPWAVLVAAVVTYLIGWAWYSPLLWAKPWLAARGKTDADPKGNMTDMPRIMFYGFVNTFMMSFVIAVFLTLTGVETTMEAIQVSLLLCFGFVVTTKFNELLYTATPPHWGKKAQTLFIIDVGYEIALFLVAGLIIWYLS